jgi:dTDP-glucose pyrophosphorylase
MSLSKVSPENLQKLCIDVNDSIRKAMQAIDQGACEITLVLDCSRRLLGTITDGDIRRALLAGASLEDQASKFMNQNFTSVFSEISRSDVLDLMRAHSLKQIPVVDGNQELVGLHLLHEMIGAVPRENWAVIMAGGRGERLRPLTNNLPKPMIKVAGRPILERIILHLVGFGIKRIFISINYLGEVIQKYFDDGSLFGCKIEYLYEDEPLGSGGSISLMPELATHPLLVLNGDLITQFDVEQMLRFHSSGKFVLTMAVYEYLHTIPYGVVEVSENKVMNINEKPTCTWLANAGIYILEPLLMKRVPKDVFFPLTNLIQECLDAKEPVGAFLLVDEWIDVGRKKELDKASGKI